jgi:hypothetical protein
MLEALASGPKTRAQLYRELSKHIPFEKALRKVEMERRRANKGPRKVQRSKDELIEFGRRTLVTQMISTAVASGHVIVERSDHRDHYGGAGGRPQDVIRLRRPDEPMNTRQMSRIIQQRKRAEEAKRRAEEARKRAAGDPGGGERRTPAPERALPDLPATERRWNKRSAVHRHNS